MNGKLMLWYLRPSPFRRGTCGPLRETRIPGPFSQIHSNQEGNQKRIQYPARQTYHTIVMLFEHLSLPLLYNQVNNRRQINTTATS